MSFCVDESEATNLVDSQEMSVARPWVNVVTHLDARYGGLSAVVPRLASEVSMTSGRAMHVAAFCTPDESCSNVPAPGVELSRWPIRRTTWLGAGLRSDFREVVGGSEGVHIHGLWEQSSFEAALAARQLDKPYIFSAHGMLEPWALRNKKLKKSIYARLVEKRNLQHARCLHALTNAEAEDYRRFGLEGPIAVIPNGVEVPENISSEPFLDSFPFLRDKRIVLFLGRIHFKKGLDILVEAWSRIVDEFPDSRLVLAGPDSENTQSKMEALISQRGIGASVHFAGMLRNELKWSALSAAECFVLPSYSEGLSVSTLEAMAAGLPVIISENCHLPEAGEAGAGWVIQATANQLSGALSEVLHNSAESNALIGQRGRALVMRQYSWSRIAVQMNEIYEWAAGGPEPRSTALVRI